MNRYKATIILIVVSIGFLISIPYHSTFIGGLLFSGFCSAMIGGFADWYGVTALFKKPFGIPYRTDIISKNRENIFNALSKMVGEELLTKSFLKDFVNEYDTSGLIIRFISKGKADKKIKDAAGFILSDMINSFRAEEAGSLLSKAAFQSLMQINLSKVLIAAAELSVNNGYDDRLIDFTVEELKVLINTDDLFSILVDMVDKTKASYEEGYRRRAVLNTVILDVFLQLSSESIASVIREKTLDYLLKFKEASNPNRLKFKTWLYLKLRMLKDDTVYQEQLKMWVLNRLDDEIIQKYITKLLSDLKLQLLKEDGSLEKALNYAMTLLDDIASRFERNHEWQKKADEQLKQLLYRIIDRVHENIELMVRENLNRYTDSMLVDLIESKAGNDLQLIRINGSVVGGLVGILIFVITKGF